MLLKLLLQNQWLNMVLVFIQEVFFNRFEFKLDMYIEIRVD